MDHVFYGPRSHPWLGAAGQTPHRMQTGAAALANSGGLRLPDTDNMTSPGHRPEPYWRDR